MLRNQILDIKKQNLQNQPEIKELEQYRRRLRLRFEGIPTAKNETNDKVFFFLSGFSFTDTDNSQEGKEREGRGPSSIPLYHFHALTNIQTLICNFAREMTITYF